MFLYPLALYRCEIIKLSTPHSSCGISLNGFIENKLPLSTLVSYFKNRIRLSSVCCIVLKSRTILGISTNTNDEDNQWNKNSLSFCPFSIVIFLNCKRDVCIRPTQPTFPGAKLYLCKTQCSVLILTIHDKCFAN